MPFSSLPLDILRLVLAWATAPSLSRLAGTCRAIDDLVIEELNFRYDALLLCYVADRPALRALLGATSSKIAGSSAALLCGLPYSFVPGDLDVYCDEHGLSILRDHLVSYEGYEVISDRLHPRYCPSSRAIQHAEQLIPVTDVDRTYRASLQTPPIHPAFPHAGGPSPTDAEYASGIAKLVHLRRDNVYVDLISSTTPASTFPIVNFWSMAPMCFLAEDAIHVLYPRLQEHNRALLNPCRLPPPEPVDPAPHLIDVIAKHKARTRSLIAKYVDRGYNIQHTEHAWDPDVSVRACSPSNAAACPFTIRWVGDSSCIHLSLRGNVAERMHVSGEDLGLGFFTAVWTRGGYPCGPFCSGKEGPVDATAYTTRLEYIQ